MGSMLKTLLLVLSLTLLTAIAYVEQSSAAVGSAKLSLNVRSGKSTGYRIVGALDKGEFFTIIKTYTNGWMKIRRTNGSTGYVNGKYARTESEAGLTSKNCGGPDCDPGPKAADVGEQSNALLESIADVQEQVDRDYPTSSTSQCLMKRILSAAKNQYKRRLNGGQRCQVAMRNAIKAAGIYGGGSYGDAKDVLPYMTKTLGFKNLLKSNPRLTPDSAPNNSILVYGAAPKKIRKKCRGLGTYFGHIEFKEDNRHFHYDGHPDRNIQKFYGAQCRPLIGVMVMGEDCPHCTRSAKKQCGG
jgi:hypothetical protein